MNMMMKGVCSLVLMGGVAQAANLEAGFTRSASRALVAASARNPFVNLLRTDMTPTREATFQVGMWKITYQSDGSGGVTMQRTDICGGEFPVNVYDMRQSTSDGDVSFRGGECNASFAKMGQGRVFVGGLEAIFAADQYGGQKDMKEYIAIAGFSSAANSYDIGYQAIEAGSSTGYQRFSVDLFDNSVGPVAGDESLLIEVRGYDYVLGR